MRGYPTDSCPLLSLQARLQRKCSKGMIASDGKAALQGYDPGAKKGYYSCQSALASVTKKERKRKRKGGSEGGSKGEERERRGEEKVGLGTSLSVLTGKADNLTNWITH